MRITSLLVVMIAALCVLSASAQTNSFESLKARYESAKSKIESEAFDAYSNSLVAAMAPLKQKGDLDTFLMIQNELKRLSVERMITSSNVQPEVVSVISKKIDTDENQKIATLTKQYVQYLEGLIKQLMSADKIEDAKEVKAELEKVKFLLADLESKLPKVEQSKAGTKQAEAKKIPSMAGKWDYAGDCIITIAQSGNEWKGDAVNSKHTRFHVSGTVTESGIITGKLEWVKAPPGKTDRDLRCQLSPDGKVISGIQNGKDYPNAKLLWTRIK